MAHGATAEEAAAIAVPLEKASWLPIHVERQAVAAPSLADTLG